MDFKKYFDTVPRNHPWNRLEELKVPFELRAVACLYFRLFILVEHPIIFPKWFDIIISFNFMFDDLEINANHFLVGPSERVSKYFKKGCLLLNFLGRTINANENALDYARFDGYIDQCNFQNVGQISFDKHILCKNRAFEPIKIS